MNEADRMLRKRLAELNPTTIKLYPKYNRMRASFRSWCDERIEVSLPPEVGKAICVLLASTGWEDDSCPLCNGEAPLCGKCMKATQGDDYDDPRGVNCPPDCENGCIDHEAEEVLRLSQTSVGQHKE
jgi:hypothetical protein